MLSLPPHSHCLCNALKSNRVGRGAEWDIMLYSDREDTIERLVHLGTELVLHLICRPVVVEIILYLFKVGYRHASGIGQDIWDHCDGASKENIICLGSRLTKHRSSGA